MITIGRQRDDKDKPDLSDWPQLPHRSDPTPDEEGKNKEGTGGRWSDIISDDTTEMP